MMFYLNINSCLPIVSAAPLVFLVPRMKNTHLHRAFRMHRQVVALQEQPAAEASEHI